MSLDLAILCRIATYRKELPDRAEDRPLRSKGAAVRRIFTNMPHQAPAGPRIFYENPLSSVAYGATPFQRKGAKNCREAAIPSPLNLLNLLNPLNPLNPLY